MKRRLSLHLALLVEYSSKWLEYRLPFSAAAKGVPTAVVNLPRGLPCE
jgi:hypothetical protein